MKIWAYVLWLFPLAVFGNQPQAVDGILNLYHYDLNAQDPISLSGEWEFYWNELKEPNSFTNKKEGVPLIEVPTAWINKQLPDGSVIPGTGYATYRLRIVTNPNNKRLALKIPTTGTSARIFINGSLEQEIGKVATQESEFEPNYKPGVIDFNHHSDTLEVVVQIANFAYKKGGMWHAFTLGSEEKLRNKHEREVFLSFFILGAMFIMGLYHLGLYLQRKQDIWNLWFAIANLIAGLRVAASGEYIITLPGILPWWVVMRLELASYFFGMAIILVYLKSLFKEEMNQKLCLVGVSISSLVGLSAIFLPSIYASELVFPFQLFSFLIIVYCVYVVILAIRNKRPGSKIFGVGFVILAIFIINDILLNMNQIYTIPMTGIGFVLFLLSQSYLLAARFTATIHKNEKLTAELDEINKDLEFQVQERTTELQESLQQVKQKQQVIQEKNAALETANNTRTKLFGIIGHDLKGPLGSLQLALQNVVEDIDDNDIDEEELKSVVKILSRSANKSFNLLNNLFEWAKSQTGELHFAPESVHLLSLVMNNLSLYKDRLDEKNIITLTNIAPEIEAYGDRNMIDTVCRNLLSNAIKFTPPNGKITVSAEVSQSENEVQVSIKDTGVGISNERIQDIFEYDRKKSTLGTNNEAGTGIGLALCKEFIEKNHGRITVDSVEGQGSSFIFTLPIRKVEF